MADTKKQFTAWKWILVVLGTALISGGIMAAYGYLWASFNQQDVDVILFLKNGISWALQNFKKWAALAVLVGGLMFGGVFYGERFGNALYRYRYWVAGAVFLFCLVFEISGSSIACWEWGGWLPKDEIGAGTLYGAPRILRSDEWAFSTPMVFSNTMKYGFFAPYFNDAVRGTSTDVMVAINAPVLGVEILSRPFTIGYLFLGVGRGLSFFWCGRLIALFLVNFEFMMLLTDGKKRLSLCGALLVAFAPAVQWWFHAGGLVEIITGGELVILAARAFLKTEKTWKKLLLMGGIVVCAYTYALVLYPAWQIPGIYVFLAFGVWVIACGIRERQFRGREIGIILAGGAVLAGLLLLFFIRSADATAALANTAYPGARFETGGGRAVKILAGSPLNLLFPYMPTDFIDPNVCENATFFDFFPIGILLAAVTLIRQKKKDLLLALLLAVTLFLGLWVFFSWPDGLAKATFLYNCPAERVIVLFGLANLFLLFRALGQSAKHPVLLKTPWKAGIAAAGGAAMGIFSGIADCVAPAWCVMLFCGAVLAAAYFVTLMRKSSWMLAFTLAVAVVGGMMVNPVQKGVNFIYENPLIQEIQRLDEEESGNWISDSLSYPQVNLPVFAGVSYLSGTNMYPVVERWRTFDPEGTYDEIYNRYAHVQMEVQKDPVAEEERFELLGGGDQFLVRLAPEDLETLGVKYCLTTRDYAELETETFHAELVSEIGQYRIYEFYYGE